MEEIKHQHLEREGLEQKGATRERWGESGRWREEVIEAETVAGKVVRDVFCERHENEI